MFLKQVCITTHKGWVFWSIVIKKEWVTDIDAGLVEGGAGLRDKKIRLTRESKDRIVESIKDEYKSSSETEVFVDDERV